MIETKQLRGLSPEERFWLQTDKRGPDDCWEWKGSKSGERYGKIRVGKERIKAHRFAYELFYGQIEPGNVVLHTCDNGFCVNPYHLRQGTQKDNVHDMLKKNRDNHANCESVNTSKLTKEQVLDIRSRYVPYKVSTTKLGKEYGVSSANISQIVLGRTWRNI